MLFFCESVSHLVLQRFVSAKYKNYYKIFMLHGVIEFRVTLK